MLRTPGLEAAVLLALATTVTSVAGCAVVPPPGVLSVTTGTVALAAFGGVATDRGNSRAGVWVAVLGTWAVVSALVSRATIPDWYLAPDWGGHGYIFLCLGAPAFAVVVAWAALKLSTAAQRLVLWVRGPIVLGLALLASGASGTYLLTRHDLRISTPSEQLESLSTWRTVPAIGTLAHQRIDLPAGVTLTRECDTEWACSIRIASRIHPDPLISRDAGLGRGELAIARLRDAYVVAARNGGHVDWSRGLAFDAQSLDQRALILADLPESAAPIEWSWSAVFSLGIALASLVLALRSLLRRRALASYADATVEDSGLVSTGEGLARSDLPLTPGPAIVITGPTHVGYRNEALGVVRSALEGTLREHRERLERHAITLGFVAILVVLAAMAPLDAANDAGLIVLAP